MKQLSVFLNFVTLIPPCFSPSNSPAASSSSLPASQHGGCPSFLALSAFVSGRAGPPFLQLQPLLLLPEFVHVALAKSGPKTRPPGFLWTLFSYTGERKKSSY